MTAINNGLRAATSSPMIEVEQLTKRFGPLLVLDGVDICAQRGQVVALLGPNGAGKTTFVRILTTLLMPDGGQARVAGYDVVSQATALRPLIGLAGQYATIDELLTGRENLELVGLWYHLPKKDYHRRAQQALERFSLTDAGDRLVKTYSGGMRRRLDIAASLIGRPPVLFLDEPTTGLDPRTREDVWEFVEELVTVGTTVLLTTQYMEEAERLAHDIVLLDTGRVVARGTACELKEQLGTSVLEVRVQNLSDLDRTAALLAEFAGSPPQVDVNGQTVTVAAKAGTGFLIGAGRLLEDQHIALDDLGIHRPSLNDVFLSLTGPGSTGTQSTQDERSFEPAGASR